MRPDTNKDWFRNGASAVSPGTQKEKGGSKEGAALLPLGRSWRAEGATDEGTLR